MDNILDLSGPRPFSFVLGSVSLACIFDDRQPVFLCDLHDRVHIRRLAEEVHGDDGLWFRREGLVKKRMYCSLTYGVIKRIISAYIKVQSEVHHACC